MRISDWSSDVCSSDLKAAKAAERRLADADAKISEKIGAAEAEIAAATASAMTEIEMIAAEAAQDMVAKISGATASAAAARSEEHTSELQSLMRLSYDVICL